MVSRFEIVDNEYIEELKDESEIENKKNSTEWWKNFFQKMGELKKLLASKLRRVWERCPRPTIVALLSIQKFSNFGLYVINLCFQKLLKLPSSMRDFGNFNNFWKHAWY